MKVELLSVAEIAEQLGCEKSRVQYLVMARRIDPVRKIGRYRLFAASVVEKLREEVNGGKMSVHAG